MQENYSLYSDEELAELAQKGDLSAEEVLIQKCRGMIKGKAHTYFIAGADSEDVIQEGMIGLYKAIRSFDISKEAAFKTYAQKCINRQIIDAIRASQRKKNEPLNSSVSLSSPIGDGYETLEDFIPSLEKTDGGLENDGKSFKMRFLEENENLFSKMEKEVLDMYLEGFSYSQIANSMGKDYKAIDNAIQRIKKKILKETSLKTELK